VRFSCLLAFAAAMNSNAQEPAAPPSGELEAASIVFEFRNKTYVATDIRLTREDVSVRADKAVGSDVNFNDGPSTFSGNVVITNARGNLRADNATVTFRDGRIATATIEGAKGGAPATFEQKLDDPDILAKGHANIMEYDVAAETVRLHGDAWATDGRDMEVRAQTLVYDIRQQKVTANKDEQGNDRVRINIDPRAADKKPPQ
jgi:lipopolysaccharide transport protein LptA